MQFEYKAYGYSTLSFVIATFLFSLLSSLLYYFSIISIHTHTWLCFILGCVSYCLAGGVLGKCITKRAMLHALPISVLLFILSLLLGNHDLIAYLLRILHLVLFITSCMILYMKKSN